MKGKTVARKLNEQDGDIVHKANQEVKSNYCAPLTKDELRSVGIVDIRYLDNKWLVYRLWYKNSSKAKELKIISITEAKRTHKYRPDKVYPKVTFSTPTKKYNIPLSRLIYVWFNGDITEPRMQVDHIDNDPYNNDPDNLELVTIEQNLAKRFVDNPEAWTNQWGRPKNY